MFSKLLSQLASISVRRPKLVLLIAGIAMALSGWAVATRLTLKSSNLDLINQKLPEVQKFLRFAEEFGTPNVLVLTFEGQETKSLEAAVDQLGPQLRALAGVRSVIDRVPYDPQVLKDAKVYPYLATRDRKLLMICVQPSDTRTSADAIGPLLASVRDVIDRAKLEAAKIHAGMTGIPVYAIDDRDVIQRDMSKLSFLSFGLIAALFVVSFRAVRRPLLAMLALVAGVLVTAGLIVIYPGHLTLLSSFFASTLFGLGIDYGIQVINRVEEFVAAGTPERDAITMAVSAQASAMLTAALTAGVGFYVMLLSGFRGFEELGAIAGTGVFVCLIAMVTVLPALMVMIPGGRHKPRPFHQRKFGRILELMHHPAIAGTLCVVAVGGIFYGGPKFDGDYLNLEPKNSEAVRLEREISNRSDFSTQFAVFVAKSKADAERLANKLMDDETVGEVRSIVDLDSLIDASPTHAPFPDYFTGGFVSKAGRYAVYAYPRGNIWEPARQQKFIAHMRAIDPDVTGMPFLGAFMVARSQKALYITGGICFVHLIVSVWIGMRRKLAAALAILPTILTIVSMGALMKLFGIALNPLNVMALPIIIGIAVDNGIYLVHRFMFEHGDLKRTMDGTGRSVFITSMTALVGFGSLMFTSHRGLASFAMAITIGKAASLVMSLVVLPEMLRIFGPRLALASSSQS
jgi:predicted RND superfamily exporter protein